MNPSTDHRGFEPSLETQRGVDVSGDGIGVILLGIDTPIGLSIIRELGQKGVFSS